VVTLTGNVTAMRGGARKLSLEPAAASAPGARGGRESPRLLADLEIVYAAAF